MMSVRNEARKKGKFKLCFEAIKHFCPWVFQKLIKDGEKKETNMIESEK